MFGQSASKVRVPRRRSGVGLAAVQTGRSDPDEVEENKFVHGCVTITNACLITYLNYRAMSFSFTGFIPQCISFTSTLQLRIASLATVCASSISRSQPHAVFTAIAFAH